MSLIQKEIADFSVQCYQNNAFRTVSKSDMLGKWSVFFFCPAELYIAAKGSACSFLRVISRLAS